MHIPDGYLSPQTCAVLGAAMLPVWGMAVRKVKRMMASRYLPLMVIGAAFSFIIMMFNIPIPDGTTAHAVGGAMLAVILGPWGASICLTIALAIQALFFGDGGILAFGANSFNMAFILPFSAYLVYRLVAGNSEPTSPRRWLGGLLGGYVGINLAALATGVEFGLQPLLFHSADGTPLYSPYPLGMAVSAMAFAHLLIAGPLEGGITALFIRYLQRSDIQLLEPVAAAEKGKGLGKLWWGLLALALLTPLGSLASGTAWGEWGLAEVRAKLGYVPRGMAHFADRWHALFPDYTIPVGAGHQVAVYCLAGLFGLAVVAGVTYLFYRSVHGRDETGTRL